MRKVEVRESPGIISGSSPWVDTLLLDLSGNKSVVAETTTNLEYWIFQEVES